MTFRRPSPAAVGVIAAVALAILYGSSYVATAFQLHGFTPLAGGFWRSLIASGLLVVVAALGLRVPGPPGNGARHPSEPWQVVAARLVTLAILGGPIFIVGMNVAVGELGAAVTAFVAGLYAILAALFAPVFVGERLGRGVLLGFILAVAGTALLGGLAPSGDAALGLAAAGGAAISFGLYLVLLRRGSQGGAMHPLAIAIVVAIGSAVTLGLLVAILEPGALLPRPGADALIATAWLILVTGGGPVLGAVSLRRIETRLASAILLLNPLSATVLAVLLLGERLSIVQLAGGVLVLAGMAVAGWRERSSRRAKVAAGTAAASASKR